MAGYDAAFGLLMRFMAPSPPARASIRASLGGSMLGIRLVERGANPVVLAAGVQAGEELRERAMPAIAATVGSSGGDGLPHVCVLAANQRDCRIGSRFGEDLVPMALLGSDVRFTLADGVGPDLHLFQGRERAPQSDHQRHGD